MLCAAALSFVSCTSGQVCSGAGLDSIVATDFSKQYFISPAFDSGVTSNRFNVVIMESQYDQARENEGYDVKNDADKAAAVQQAVCLDYTDKAAMDAAIAVSVKTRAEADAAAAPAPAPAVEAPAAPAPVPQVVPVVKKRLALQPPPRKPVAPSAAPAAVAPAATPAAATAAAAPAAPATAAPAPVAAAPVAAPVATEVTPAAEAAPAPKKRLALQPLPRTPVPAPVAASVNPAPTVAAPVNPAPTAPVAAAPVAAAAPAAPAATAPAPAAPAAEPAAAASRPMTAPIAAIQAATATAAASLAELEAHSLLESEASVGGSLCTGAACKAYCTGGVANVAAMNKRAQELGIAAVDPASLRSIPDAIYAEFVKRGCTPKNKNNLETGFANCGLLLKAGLTLLPDAIAKLAEAALKVRDYRGPAPMPLACLPNTEAARAAERRAQAARATAPATPQKYAIFVVSAARTLKKQMDLLCAHFPKGQNESELS